MRERESPSPTDRPNSDGWIRVSRRNSRNPPQKHQQKPGAIKTIYINHLPPDTRPSDIGPLFGKYGKIHNIIIPPLTNKHPKFRFAFIRFVESKPQKLAIREMNGVNLEGRTLIVQPANFDSPPPSMKSTAGNQPNYKKNPPNQTKPSTQIFPSRPPLLYGSVHTKNQPYP